MRGTPAPAGRIAVVGGAGAMGRITVLDLAHTAPPGVEIVIADRDVGKARALARGLPRPCRAIEIDAAQPRTMTRALAGVDVIVNACHHSFNLRVMDAALALDAHYCDLGGLFHVTREQLRRDREFRRAGLLAICGIGSAPGIVNVMARAAAERLDDIRELHIAVGTVDRTAGVEVSPLATSYSILTVLDEASRPAPLFTDGRLTFVEPLSHDVAVDFPAPVGRQYPACVLHSELATLPATFRAKGLREASFRIAFPGDLTERLRFVHRLGLTSTKPVDVNGTHIAPRDVLLALVKHAPAPRDVTSPFWRKGVEHGDDAYEILRVTARGKRGGIHRELTLDCHVPGVPAWKVGVDIDTGAPPSIVAQMMLTGGIPGSGVLPPERCIPPAPFFRALSRRGMRIVRRSTVARR